MSRAGDTTPDRAARRAFRGDALLAPQEEHLLSTLARRPGAPLKQIAFEDGKKVRAIHERLMSARRKLGARTNEEALAIWRRAKRASLLFSDRGAPIGRAERAIADILAQLQEETGLRVESIALDGAAGALSPLVFVEER
jgi:DNA-binding CsgD family transcriptional regulator